MIFQMIAFLAAAVIMVDMLLLNKTTGMNRQIVLVFLLARLNWLLLFLLIAFGLITELGTILITGILAIVFLFSTEVLMMVVSILGDKHAKSK